MDKIGKDRALELLTEVVAEAGDSHVMAGPCIYYADPWGQSPSDAAMRANHVRPLCIVGHVFAKVGITSSMLMSAGPFNYNGIPFLALPPSVLDCFTPAARDVLERAQVVQDGRDDDGTDPLAQNRKTWGEALIAAKEEAGTWDEQ
jgi:hypothetical protein